MNIALLRPWCAVIPALPLPAVFVCVCVRACPCLWQRQFGSSFDQTFCWFCCVSLSVSLTHSAALLNWIWLMEKGTEKCLKAARAKHEMNNKMAAFQLRGLLLLLLCNASFIWLYQNSTLGYAKLGSLLVKIFATLHTPCEAWNVLWTGKKGYIWRAEGSIPLQAVNWCNCSSTSYI